jgi:predicted MPP superfamily phosphohydrolase
VLFIIVIASLAIGNQWVNDQFIERVYSVSTTKISQPVRIALLTDLHQTRYGERSERLVAAIERSAPDLVVFGGDMTDLRADPVVFRNLLDQLGERFPLAFVAGNHEVWTEQLVEIKEMVKAHSGIVLDGVCVDLELREQRMTLCGLDDPVVGLQRYKTQLEKVLSSERSPEDFSLMISHRPEWRRIKLFVEAGFDLILSGHTHGGQIRIPGLLNGLFAPNQGLSPKISGGEYFHQQTVQIVSRGLTRDSFGFPRIFNQPELVIIDLKPQENF